MSVRGGGFLVVAEGRWRSMCGVGEIWGLEQSTSMKTRFLYRVELKVQCGVCHGS